MDDILNLIPQDEAPASRPEHLEDLAPLIERGAVVQVQPDTGDEERLASSNGFGEQIGDLVLKKDGVVVVLYLKEERKRAYLIPCKHTGCKRVRVARTSDVRAPVNVSRCKAHKRPAPGSKGARVETPIDLGDLMEGL